MAVGSPSHSRTNSASKPSHRKKSSTSSTPGHSRTSSLLSLLSAGHSRTNSGADDFEEPTVLPPAEAALSKQMLQELVNADSSRFLTPAEIEARRNAESQQQYGRDVSSAMMAVRTHRDGSAITTAQIRRMLSYTFNHYGQAWVALVANEEAAKAGRVKDKPYAKSPMYTTSVSDDILTRPMACPPPTYILKRGAVTALRRKRTLRDRRRDAEAARVREEELATWNKEMEVCRLSLHDVRHTQGFMTRMFLLFVDNRWRTK